MKFVFLFLTLGVLLGCNLERQSSSDKNVDSQQNNPDGLNVPNGFDYKTHRDITVRLQVLDHTGFPAQQVGVRIYPVSETFHNDPILDSTDALSSPIYKNQTNNSGYLEDQIRVPGHWASIYVVVNQLGIQNSVILPIEDYDIFHEFF